MTTVLGRSMFRPAFLGQSSFSVKPITLAVNHDEIPPNELRQVLRSAVPKGFVGTSPYVVKTLDGEYLVYSGGMVQFFPLGRSPGPMISLNGGGLGSRKLGQGYDISPGPDTGDYSGGDGNVDIEMKCYDCGPLVPPIMLFASVGDPNPACKEVDAALCGAAPPQLPPGKKVEIPVRAFLPDDMSPLAGANVVIERVAGGSVGETKKGVTGSDGRYLVLEYIQPSETLQVTLKPSAVTPGFDDVTFSSGVPAYYSFPQHLNRQIVVRPWGTSNLIYEIAERQALWMSMLIAAGSEHGFLTPQHAALANDQAHAAIMNWLPTDTRLGRHWIDTYSFWVGDFGIPPKDWSKLLDWSHQTFEVFNSIPWPTWEPKIQEWFMRCARGIPITQSKTGANYTAFNPRLFAEKFSNYFPKSDGDIERDMAIRYIQALSSIFVCVAHKFKQKEKEVRRSMATMSLLSLSATVIFSPMLVAAGPAGLSIIMTELTSSSSGGLPTTQGVAMATAVTQLAKGDPQFLIDALLPAIAAATADLPPVAQSAVESLLTKIVNSAVETVAGDAGIGSDVNSVSAAQTAGSLAFAMWFKLMTSVIKAYGFRRLKEFSNAATGMAMAVDDFRALTSHETVSPHLQPFFLWYADAIGIEKALDDAIDKVLDEFQDALEAGEAQGGSVAIVPEEGGGFAIVPTTPEGTPTDDDGDPLPGGVAPEREVELPSQGPDMVALVGVGGAAAILLAVTGAI